MPPLRRRCRAPWSPLAVVVLLTGVVGIGAAEAPVNSALGGSAQGRLLTRLASADAQEALGPAGLHYSQTRALRQILGDATAQARGSWLQGPRRDLVFVGLPLGVAIVAALAVVVWKYAQQAAEVADRRDAASAARKAQLSGPAAVDLGPEPGEASLVEQHVRRKLGIKLRRRPSVHTDRVIVRVNSGSGGTPRPQQGWSSAESSPPDSPAHPDASVDASVKARDITRRGWAVNPHAGEAHSAAGPAEHASPASSPASAGSDAASRSSSLPAREESSLGSPGSPDFRLGTGHMPTLPQHASWGAGSAQREAEGLSMASSIGPQDIAGLSSAAEEQERGACSAQEAAPPLPVTVPGQVVYLTGEQCSADVALGRLLGTGGAGSVYEASWRGLRVACKVIHPSLQGRPQAQQQHRREVEVMASVGRHPLVLSVLGACLDPPSMCIITELCPRGSLSSVLHEEGLRPEYGTLLQLAEDVADAMQYCHDCMRPAVVHLDLKSSNILMGADGKARVADFGLSRVKTRTFLTADQGALGTAAYQAPEAMSASAVDERCDVWSWGCILYEMITGMQPWGECTNVLQIVMAVGVEHRRLPIPRDCPRPLAQLLRECWRQAPARRPCFADIVLRLRQLRVQEAAAGSQHKGARLPQLSAAKCRAPALTPTVHVHPDRIDAGSAAVL